MQVDRYTGSHEYKQAGMYVFGQIGRQITVGSKIIIKKQVSRYV